MKGRFNLFQSTMLRWREMHPYNAVHVITIERPLDAARLARDIDTQLEFEGLTGLELDAARRRYEYRGGSARTALATLPGMPDPDEAVRAEMERQLNAPFPPSGRIEPFRFFAVDAGARFYFGVTYDHFIAGGDSIAVLLKGITDRHSGAAVDAQAKQLYPATFARLFARHAWSFLTGIPHIAMIFAGCWRAFRPESHGGDDPQNALERLRVEGADFDTLSRVAATWGVTGNELLIALLLRALSPFAAERWSGRRNRLAIGSIINVRSDYQPGPTRVFGQFLSSCRVASPVRPELALRDLALDVRAQLRRVRTRRLYLQMLVMIAISGLVWPRLSPGQRSRFHAKHYPLMAGITPLNVNAIWREAGGGAPPRYLRAVSTGPLAPLIVAATKAGDAIELGLTFRTATFSRDEVSRIARAVHDGIAELEV
jgi:hypothetical protein